MGEEIKLKRSLNFWHVALSSTGIILGAGIYVLIGEVAALSGNAIWLSFLLAAIVAGLTALSYAELSSLFPKAAGEAYYAKKAFGKRLSFLVGWLLLSAQIIATAAVALGFASYFGELFFNSEVNFIFIAIILTLISAAIVFKGVKESAIIGIIFTIIEALGLIIIIAIGIPYLGSVNYFDISINQLTGVMSAAALIFFAFIGFDQIVQLAEETKNASKTIPKAIIVSISIATILYILTAISAVSIISWEALATSKAPLALVASTVLGSKAFFILALIALFSTGNTVLLVMLSSSRLMYGMAKTKTLPFFLSRVHKKTRTPYIAICTIAILIILFVLIGDISSIANISNYAIFIVFILVNLSVIVLRYKEKDLKRGFTVPFSIGNFPVIPAIALIFCLVLALNIALKEIIYGTILLFIGIAIYEIFIKKLYKWKLRD